MHAGQELQASDADCVSLRAQHAFNCNRGGGAIRRHDCVVRALGRCVRQVGLVATVEPRAIYEGTGNGGPDLALFEFPWAGDRREMVFVDVAVVNPAQKSSAEENSRVPLKAAARREACKQREYAALEESRRGLVVGAAIETPGGLGAGFWHILNKAAKFGEAEEVPLPDHVTWTANKFSSYMHQQIAVALVNSSYRMRSFPIDSKWGPGQSVARGVGNRDMAP